MILPELEGKNIVITGAGSGFGRRFSKVLVDQGCYVYGIGRRLEALEETRSQCLHPKAFTPIVGDITKPENLKPFIDGLPKIYGLVNNAGTNHVDRAEECSFEDWDKVLKTNISGMFYMCSLLFPKFEKDSRIINIGSVAANGSLPYMPTIGYCTSKGAVRSFTKALASEWAKYDIKVNEIAPVFFETEMTKEFVNSDSTKGTMDRLSPMKRAGKEGELDSTLLYLLAESSRFITGTTHVIDGGWSCGR